MPRLQRQRVDEPIDQPRFHVRNEIIQLHDVELAAIHHLPFLYYNGYQPLHNCFITACQVTTNTVANLAPTVSLTFPLLKQDSSSPAVLLDHPSLTAINTSAGPPRDPRVSANHDTLARRFCYEKVRQKRRRNIRMKKE